MIQYLIPVGLLYLLTSGKEEIKGEIKELPTEETRKSCMECVEKHLGAAYILMGEHRDGYPHRLRAIGHLHEAEDESQKWPTLHNAIREARKDYQQKGKVPDFVKIGNIIDNL